MTDNFSIAWKKDGADLTTGKSITVNATDVDGKALYRFEALDANGNVKGFYEVTITDVGDGTNGISPIVEINEDTSLTITDAEGKKTTDPLKGADGVSSYTHIKYSDDGETFTGKGNLVSREKKDWVYGYYSSSTTIDTKNPDSMIGSNNYQRLCMKKVIPVTPGETYQMTSGHAYIDMGVTRYGADGNAVGVTIKKADLVDKQYVMPDDTYYVRVFIVGAFPYVTSSNSWDTLFNGGSVSPVFGESESKLGSYPGAWMGTMTSDSPVASTNFNDYTWVKIKGENGEPTGITESAEEPAEKYVGMLWKNTGTTSGLVQGATYRWNGESWDMYKFSAENIEAETFKGYTFDGSIFKSDFVDTASPYLRYAGSMDIRNGLIHI